MISVLSMFIKFNKWLLKFIFFIDSFNFCSSSFLFNTKEFNCVKTFLYFSFCNSFSLFNLFILPSFSSWIFSISRILLSYSYILSLLLEISFFKSWFSLYKSSILFFSFFISAHNFSTTPPLLLSKSFAFNCSDKSLFSCFNIDIFELLLHI